ncbi:Interferon-induced GTP-binding protein Mx [Termitomyces sp. J132]|nr:Interferon-induced GTP-binding protein Mx [Termitomyces sp. J132]
MDSNELSSTPTPISGLAEEVGLANPIHSQTSRQMLDLVNRLHSTGVQLDIDLPQIAVIGSQSAGKSSLIESISGITLPRAAGTCTRCPTECRLSRSTDPWRCTVHLRITDNGKTRTERFGDVITNKAEVEERIRRAQWAILNPTLRNAHGTRHFLTGDDHGVNLELSFSSCLVSLQISGPDVADLSFCDLPGLIAGVGSGGNIGDIDLVKNLVATYIKRPSCIILLTVACETDFQNQGAQEMAKLYDPEGKRTVGVLTKPDRIPTGEEQNWMGILRNEKEPLENGWYCVKQPSSAEIAAGVTWERARKNEDEFFASTAVWSDLDEMYKKYLRTKNLVERLSALLSDLISKRLPEIQDEIDNSIIATRNALHNLPKPPSSDPRNEIASLLHAFVRDLARHVEGVPEDGLLQAIRPTQEQFRRTIRMTAPDFQPFEKRTSSISQDIIPNPDAIYIDEVMRRADEARTRELPGNYPFVVQETYIKAIIKKWHKFLAHYRTAREKDRNPKLMAAIEQYNPLSNSSVSHPNSGLPPPAPTGIAKVLSGLVEMGILGVRFEALAKLIESDGMEPALAIMADVRAYFQVAYKRFADNVPLAIDYELIWGVERNVLETLSKGLGINGDNGDRICKELAQENATIAVRREELAKKLERMHMAGQQLLQIGF